jgi:hypothetical protein
MGATQNRYDNILMLFRFLVSFGIADFSADTNSKLTIGAFFFHFKFLKPIACSSFDEMTPHLLQYSIAVSSCSTALVPTHLIT